MALRDGDVVLERSRPSDLDDLVAAVNMSLAELRGWMPWAQEPATVESITTFLAEADRSWNERREFQFSMRAARGVGVPRPPVRDRAGGEAGGQRTGAGDLPAVIGYCGLHGGLGPGSLEIGYWVRSDCTGRGVATSAARALCRCALSLRGIDHVEVHCDEQNAASAAVPGKLGFRLERVDSYDAEVPAASGRMMIWVRSREGFS